MTREKQVIRPEDVETLDVTSVLVTKATAGVTASAEADLERADASLKKLMETKKDATTE